MQDTTFLINRRFIILDFSIEEEVVKDKVIRPKIECHAVKEDKREMQGRTSLVEHKLQNPGPKTQNLFSVEQCWASWPQSVGVVPEMEGKATMCVGH